MNAYIQYASTGRIDKCAEFVMIQDMTNKLELATNRMEVMGSLTDHVYLQVNDRKSGTPFATVHDKNIFVKALIR